MSSPSRDFLKEINQKTRVILWLSSNALTLKTPGIKECDYLCDGLINNFIKNSGSSEINQNTFYTENFGEKLYIAFYKDSKTTLADIDDVMGLLPQSTVLENDKFKVIILNATLSKDKENETLAELIRRYRNFDFISYSFN